MWGLATAAAMAWCGIAIDGAANGADSNPAATVSAIRRLNSRLGFMEPFSHARRQFANRAVSRSRQIVNTGAFG
jgi:hypothetical protein